MKTFILLVILLVILFLVVRIFLSNSNQQAEDPARPSKDKKPALKMDNDKLIMVDHVMQGDIRLALTKFCNLYNKDDFAALPRLWQIATDSYAVTFPYDTDFATFCFAANFLKYPIGIKWDGRVKGWTTIKTGDDWIDEQNNGKRVMLYLAEYDKEYDNVFMTTQDNIGYKLDFSGTNNTKPLSTPIDAYQEPPMLIDRLKAHSFEDFD